MSSINRRTIVFLGAATLIITLACSISMAPTASAPPAFDSTKAVLELQGTAMSLQLTQSAMNAQPAATQPPPVIVVQPTDPPPPTESIPQPTPTQDLQVRMKTAKILVYEDSMAVPLRPWVKPTLDMMGLNTTYTADIGDLMNYLNSGTKWDLIIIAAEARGDVQGEFFDVITPKVTNDKTALILEMWYLSNIAVGRINQLMTKCGIQFEKVRGEVDSIYTLKPDHPVFTTPNSGFGLTNYWTFWHDKGGDYVKVTGGDAQILAGGFPSRSSDYGLITSCIGGRVIIQTFSDHDYRQGDIQALWENYITYVLTNHFAVVP
jgi:hypothetical protein